MAKKFDPEGSGYDAETAAKLGFKPDVTGHWQSRDPNTGLLLKGRGHKTWYKTVRGEKAAGYEIYKGKDGRYYSRKKEPVMAKDEKLKRVMETVLKTGKALKPKPVPKKKPSWVAQAIAGKRWKMSKAAHKAQKELGKEPRLGYAETVRQAAREEVIKGLMESGLTREEAMRKLGL